MKKRVYAIVSLLSILVVVVYLMPEQARLAWTRPSGPTHREPLPPMDETSIAVAAAVETDPVPSRGDAADDPAIWIHPTDPSRSVIIGTDKKAGLAVYDLIGQQLQYLPDGELNNVDVRSDFPLGGQLVALVTASNRAENSIAIYRVNPATRMLENVAAREIFTTDAYGSCMYRSAVTGKYYYFVNSKAGVVEQWELFDNGAGKVDGRRVRSFDVGTTTEGCVADDELGYLYIGEQSQGIWKYGAEPGNAPTRTLVDTTGPGGHLTAQVEGLALYYAGPGTGYLIASSQGRNEFVIYRRESDNDYVMRVKITPGNGIDEVTHTDGIDVVSGNLGPLFPEGVLVVQDHQNDGGNQNFKLVSWQAITAAMQSTKQSVSGRPLGDGHVERRRSPRRRSAVNNPARSSEHST